MRIFKISLLLLSFTGIFLSVNISKTYAQVDYVYSDTQGANHHTKAREQPAESKAKSKLLSELKELNKAKGVYFMFANKAIGDKLVNHVDDMNSGVESVLDKILVNTGLTYKKVNNNTYVILAEKENFDARPAGFMQSSLQTIQPKFIVDYDVITGRVVDPAGNPVSGVTVEVKGKKTGTSTNENGVFTIEASKGDVLVFSSVGFETQEITVGDENNISVQMAETSKR